QNMHLDPHQLRASQHKDGPCLVLAGPGSGKTTVIARRLKTMTETMGIPQENILVITFTRAAAGEMQARFLKLKETPGCAVTFGTFHSVFWKVLRTHCPVRAQALLPERRKRQLMAQVLKKTPLAEYGTDELADILLAEISLVKNSLADPHVFRSKVPQADFADLFAQYERAVREAGKLDYDDILVRTLQLFREEPGILAYYRDRFRYILVDEFQDVNPLQYAILRLLAQPLNNLFAVGDDDQSVYRFRSADPRIMLDFPRDWPGTAVVTLPNNYRSCETVVKAASRLIRHNRERYEKKLTAAGGKGRGKLEKRLFRNEKEESAYIAGMIEEGARNGRKYGEYAVLYRTGLAAQDLIRELMDRKIPFRFREQLPNMYRNEILQPVYAYLNWVLGDRSRANFLKFMNCPVRYFRRGDIDGTVDLETLQARFRAEPGREYLAEKTAFLSYQPDFLKKARAPYAMIHYIRKAVGYDVYLKEKAAGQQKDASELIALLDEVQESALKHATVEEWYAHIAAYTKALEQQEREEKGAGKDAVTVATFHGAKGLEFRTVVIPDANERVTPHEKAASPEDLEEERRMFYVAVTRAIGELYVFSVKERFGKPLEVSRFVKELE
ncbi:MAG: ATP-dependent helicase, partial [Lachnospiraceae bacterium]|nr:ATP-dependent helicase [Lachnospiraceae bacterium]